MQDLLEVILNKSKNVDQQFADITEAELLRLGVHFPVPEKHPRYQDIDHYDARVSTISKNDLPVDAMVVADSGLRQIPWFVKLADPAAIHYLEPKESTTKEWKWLNYYIANQGLNGKHPKRVVGIGGGLILNVAAFLAEKYNSKLTLIPTTVIGMADGSGGKVRINLMDRHRNYKHYYKSFYEPNNILVDPRWLDTLSAYKISVGLGEIVKHGIYQSSHLLLFLLSAEFDPEKDRQTLLKAILWTAALKAVCLEVDVEENANGSRRILRGGHELSDRIEEDSNFLIPHGFAVAMGIYRELELTNSPARQQFIDFCTRFNIPTSREDYSVVQ